jgi:hypothetical protein
VSTVFISHVTEDKPLLEPILNLLIAAGFDLWIDSPDQIGTVWYAAHRQSIKRIMPGQNWRVTLQEQLDSVDVVLAFWSRSAVALEREIFLFEVDYARLQGKCVQVIIDGTDTADIPAAFRHDQIFRIRVDDLHENPVIQDILTALRVKNRPRGQISSDLLLVSANLDDKASNYDKVGSRIIPRRSQTKAH